MWWLVAIAPLYRLIMMILVPSNSRIQYLSTPSRMDELAIGVLIAIIIRRDTRLPTRRNAAMLFIVLFVLFLVAAITGALGHDQAFGRVLGYSLVGLMFGALVLWTVLSRDHIATSPLRFSPLCYLGRLCYGLYLLQRPCGGIVIKLGEKLGYSLDPNALITMFAKIGVTIIAATLSWNLFERQILKLKDRFQSNRHPAGAV